MSARLAHYGPGDPITWGECTGHPNDPRTEEPEPDDEAGRITVDALELEEAFHSLMAAARSLAGCPDPAGLVPRCYRAAGRLEAILNAHTESTS